MESQETSVASGRRGGGRACGFDSAELHRGGMSFHRGTRPIVPLAPAFAISICY